MAAGTNNVDTAGVTELLDSAGGIIGIQFTQTGGDCDSNDALPNVAVPAKYSLTTKITCDKSKTGALQ